MQDDTQRKQQMYQTARTNVEEYIREAEENPEGKTFADIEKTKELREAIGGLDVNTEEGWKAFSQAANKVGWDVGSLLLQPSEKEAMIAQEAQKAKVESAKELEKAGISGDMSTTLSGQGFEVVPEYASEQMP